MGVSVLKLESVLCYIFYCRVVGRAPSGEC